MSETILRTIPGDLRGGEASFLPALGRIQMRGGAPNVDAVNRWVLTQIIRQIYTFRGLYQQGRGSPSTSEDGLLRSDVVGEIDKENLILMRSPVVLFNLQTSRVEREYYLNAEANNWDENTGFGLTDGGHLGAGDANVFDFKSIIPAIDWRSLGSEIVMPGTALLIPDHLIVDEQELNRFAENKSISLVLKYGYRIVNRLDERNMVVPEIEIFVKPLYPSPTS